MKIDLPVEVGMVVVIGAILSYDKIVVFLDVKTASLIGAETALH